MTKCIKMCVEGTKVKATSGKDAGKTVSTAGECNYVLLRAKAGGKSSTCVLMRSGRVPKDMWVPPVDAAPKPGDSEPVFVSLMAFPRRKDLYRQATCADKRYVPMDTAGKKYVICESDRDRNDPSMTGGTVVYDEDAIVHKGCVATKETLKEVSVSYYGTAKIPKFAAMPSSVEVGSSAFTVTSGAKTSAATGKEFQWTYTRDSKFRVTQVSGILTKETRIRGKRGSSSTSPGAFEAKYNAAMLKSMVDERADFAAGHIIAAQMAPPNAFFNYVPQSAASNSNGCWYQAEIATTALLAIGCNLNYDVHLEYDDAGLLPSKIVNDVPFWVRDSFSKRLADKATSSKPPPDAYKHDELYCHYQFRPVKMRLNTTITGAVPGSTCQNMVDAGLSGNLFTVKDDKVQISRIMAVTLTKSGGTQWFDRFQKNPATGSDAIKQLRGMVTTSTAARSISVPQARGPPETVACYQEYGSIANLAWNLVPEFKDAFLHVYSTPKTSVESFVAHFVDEVKGQLTITKAPSVPAKSGKAKKPKARILREAAGEVDARLKWTTTETLFDRDQVDIRTNVGGVATCLKRDDAGNVQLTKPEKTDVSCARLEFVTKNPKDGVLPKLERADDLVVAYMLMQTGAKEYCAVLDEASMKLATIEAKSDRAGCSLVTPSYLMRSPKAFRPTGATDDDDDE